MGGRNIQRGYAGQREDSCLGRMGQDGTRFHYTTQSDGQVKTYEVLVPGVFHVMFSDGGWLWATETAEHEAVGKGRDDRTWA